MRHLPYQAAICAPTAPSAAGSDKTFPLPNLLGRVYCPAKSTIRFKPVYIGEKICYTVYILERRIL